MKNICSILLLLMAFCSCEPLVDNKSLGEIVSEDDLVLDVHNTTEGGNEIIMTNNTPGVGSYWNYITGVAAQKSVTVTLPFMGEQEITFTGFCKGGTVTTTRKVIIDKIDHPITQEWSLFAGNEISGKSWVWNLEDYNGIVYGTGGWLTEFAPSWDVCEPENLEDANCELVFDLNGGPNLSKKDANGNIIEKGTFAFDMSVIKQNPDHGTQWSIGQLTISGVSVLSGHAYYDETNIITTFEILEQKIEWYYVGILQMRKHGPMPHSGVLEKSK